MPALDVLDEKIRYVTLQFSFAHAKAVPAAMTRHSEPETFAQSNERKTHSSGTMIIEPIENVSLGQFVRELVGAGYELVDAFCQERLDRKDPNGRKTYWMVRFMFVRRECMVQDDFEAVRFQMMAALTTMCTTAMWRVRAFNNPCYQNGEEVASQRTWVVNLEARKPLFQGDGTPVVVWQKDERGERVGDAPEPLRPHLWLMVWPELHICTMDPDNPD